MIKHAKTATAFAAGFVCAALLAAFLLTVQEADAVTITPSLRACYNKALNYSYANGFQANDDINVAYNFPTCMGDLGYKMKKIQRYDSSSISIVYTPK